jgi:LysM repeat protein
MKISYYLLVLMLFNTVLNEVFSQQLKENEIVVIQGEKFVLHQVRTGETVYSISRQFNVDSQVIAKHNPQISEGLKIGDILKIPYNEQAIWQQNIPASPKGDPLYFDYYTISSRTETPYFIAREFGITIEEIYAYNPEVSRFRKGTKLRIPRWEIPPVTKDKDIIASERVDGKEPELIMHEVQSGETLYSLARRYKISESEILFINPGARELKAGSVIYIPRTGGVFQVKLQPTDSPVLIPKAFQHSLWPGVAILNTLLFRVKRCGR